MKKTFLHLLVISLFIVSCSKETGLPIEPAVNNPVETAEGRFDHTPFQWDYTYMPFLAPGEFFIGNINGVGVNQESAFHPLETRGGRSSGPHRDSSGGRNSGETPQNESGVIVQNPTGVYIGSVYPITSIDSGLFDKEVTNLKKNPVRMLFRFPTDFRYQMTDYKDEWEYSEALEKALNSKNYEDHVTSLSEGGKQETGYSITEYTSLKDIEKAFGANVKMGSVFSGEVAINSKNVNVQGRMLAYLVGRNFKVAMVSPANGFFEDANNNKRTDLAYVRSMSYGKLAFVSIESEYSYNEIKKAFEAGLKYKFVDANMKYDEHVKDVFAKSRITIMSIGDNSTESFYTNTTAVLENMFKTNYTKLAYGKPVFMELNKVNDGSIYLPGDGPSSDEGRSSGNRGSSGGSRDTGGETGSGSNDGGGRTGGRSSGRTGSGGR